MIYFPQFVYDEVQLLFGHDLVEEKFKSLCEGSMKISREYHKINIFSKFLGLDKTNSSGDLVRIYLDMIFEIKEMQLKSINHKAPNVTFKLL